jgi:GntR family transcriptional regulator of vanillate catabolism
MTRTQEITDQLREMIATGVLAPDANLNEAALANTLGASRTPIRHALNALAAEGFCEYRENRGYFVTRFTLQDVLDAFDLRGLLEGAACRTVAERGLDPARISALEATLGESEIALYGSDWGDAELQRWHASNLEFHNLILEAAGNRTLIATVQQLRRLAALATSRARPANETALERVFLRDHSRQALADHRKILAALKAGQAERVDYLMREHIFTNREVVRQRGEAASAAEGPPMPKRRKREPKSA